MGRIGQRLANRIGSGLSLALVALLLLLGQSQAQSPSGLPVGQLFLQSPSATGDAAQYLGVVDTALAPLDISGQSNLYRLLVPNGDELTTAADLAARPDVLYAEPDYLFFVTETTPDDSLYDRYQWNLRHIHANTGWDRTTGSRSVVIGIVDTGVDLGHPDLAEKIVGGIDTVNNDFVAQDDQGHGTHVASIAASLGNNNRGIAGVDWNARIMPVKGTFSILRGERN